MTATFAPGDLVQARGREWVVLPSPDSDWLCLRPLSGVEADVQLLHPALEREPVRHASFDMPGAEQIATQDAARLLSDALRMSLRRGAGPFRSAARLSFEPRAYQLVPLLMALRLPVVRLLIAATWASARPSRPGSRPSRGTPAPTSAFSPSGSESGTAATSIWRSKACSAREYYRGEAPPSQKRKGEKLYSALIIDFTLHKEPDGTEWHDWTLKLEAEAALRHLGVLGTPADA